MKIYISLQKWERLSVVLRKSVLGIFLIVEHVLICLAKYFLIFYWEKNIIWHTAFNCWFLGRSSTLSVYCCGGDTFHLPAQIILILSQFSGIFSVKSHRLLYGLFCFRKKAGQKAFFLLVVLFTSWFALCFQYANRIYKFVEILSSPPRYVSFSLEILSRILKCSDVFHMSPYWKHIPEKINFAPQSNVFIEAYWNCLLWAWFSYNFLPESFDWESGLSTR